MEWNKVMNFGDPSTFGTEMADRFVASGANLPPLFQIGLIQTCIFPSLCSFCFSMLSTKLLLTSFPKKWWNFFILMHRKVVKKITDDTRRSKYVWQLTNVPILVWRETGMVFYLMSGEATNKVKNSSSITNGILQITHEWLTVLKETNRPRPLLCIKRAILHKEYHNIKMLPQVSPLYSNSLLIRAFK